MARRIGGIEGADRDRGHAGLDGQLAAGLDIIAASGLADAAQRAVAAVEGK